MCRGRVQRARGGGGAPAVSRALRARRTLRTAPGSPRPQCEAPDHAESPTPRKRRLPPLRRACLLRQEIREVCGTWTLPTSNHRSTKVSDSACSRPGRKHPPRTTLAKAIHLVLSVPGRGPKRARKGVRALVTPGCRPTLRRRQPAVLESRPCQARRRPKVSARRGGNAGYQEDEVPPAQPTHCGWIDTAAVWNAGLCEVVIATDPTPPTTSKASVPIAARPPQSVRNLDIINLESSQCEGCWQSAQPTGA